MHSLSKLASKIPNVAIVGAGAAGLRCADVLIRSGVNVTIFEARNRVGGRIHQAESAGHLMDLGPNWIHGTNNNPIMTIAQRTKTVLYEPEEFAAVYDSDGKRRSDEDAARILQVVWGTIVKAFRYSDEHSEIIDSTKSLMDYFKDQIPQQEKNPAMIEDMLKMAQMWSDVIGDPVERQSLKFFFLEECIDGENPFVASTYKAILADLSATAIKHAKIRFNTEVTYFQVNESSSERYATTITTAGGLEETFDEVIITCPLGWLKRHRTIAFPSSLLPPSICQAIDNLGYGRLEKVYVTFRSAFWISRLDHQSSDTTPVFNHFLSPNYIHHPASVPWYQSPISLGHLPPAVAHPTLLFYVSGPVATTIVSTISSLAPDSPEYYNALNSIFHPFYSRLSNYDSTDHNCQPIAFLATQWQNDAFAGNGSYLNIPVGLAHADRDIEALRTGLGEDKGLWFAGEHTAPFIALGTTTGAYWAGEGVARRICTKWGVEIAEEMDTALVHGESQVVRATKKTLTLPIMMEPI